MRGGGRGYGRADPSAIITIGAHRDGMLRRITQAFASLISRSSLFFWGGSAISVAPFRISSHLLRVAADHRATEVSDSVMRVIDANGEVDTDSPIAAAIAQTDIASLLYETEHDYYTLGCAAWYIDVTGTRMRIDGSPTPMTIRKIRNPAQTRIDDAGRLVVSSLDPRERGIYDRGEFVFFQRYDGDSAEKRLRDVLALFDRLWAGRRLASDRARMPVYVLESGGIGTQRQLDEWHKNYERRLDPNFVDADGAVKSDTRIGVSLLRGMRLRFPTMPEDKGASEWIDMCIKVVSADSGVPAHDLGSRSNLTYSNQKEFNAHFRDVIIEPECGMMARKATAQLASAYLPQGGRIDIELRKSSVARLENDKMRADTRAVHAQTAATLVQSGVMEVDQAREYFRDLESSDE